MNYRCRPDRNERIKMKLSTGEIATNVSDQGRRVSHEYVAIDPRWNLDSTLVARISLNLREPMENLTIAFH